MSANSYQVPCLVCRQPLSLRPARGRKSGKPFLMLVCPIDGRHFRAFINDQAFVASVMGRLEAQTAVGSDGVDPEGGTTPFRRSKTNSERAI